MSSPAAMKQKQSHQKKKKKNITLKGLKTLGHELLSSRAHVNNLTVLLDFISPSSPIELALESLVSLQSFFVPLLPEIPSSSAKFGTDEEKDPESLYRAWLRAKFDEFVSSLIEIAVSPQSTEALRDVSLDAIMDFVKLGKGGTFQSVIYHRFLHSIVRATSSADLLLDLLAPKYFKYIDVRYYTYTSVYKISKAYESTKSTDTRGVGLHDERYVPESSKMELNIRIIHNVLSRVPPLVLSDKETSYETWSQLDLSLKEVGKVPSEVLVAGAKPKRSKDTNNDVSSTTNISKKLKPKFTKAWISFLKLPLPLDVYKEVLVSLHQNVVPYIANPLILCDFLTSSYDIGGVISVMALSGLFILMTQHNLDYPKFYEKLYELLTPAVFMAKHRAVFFQLLDTCLKSSYLSARLAAAFAKKLSRLALSVQPSGALIIIAIIHNLLRRHPSINFLVHQLVDDKTVDASVGGNESSKDARESDSGPFMHSKKQCVDPFNSEESDPAESDAMRSSLWEIDTLRHHYCPAVSRFVASLENDLTVRAKTSEVAVTDFSSGSYATIFREEIRRRIKQVPLAFYQVTPTSLFWEPDFAGWTFTDQHNAKENKIEENGVLNTLENDDREPTKRQRIETS